MYIINLQHVFVGVCRLLAQTLYWCSFAPIHFCVNILLIFVFYSKVPLALTYDARHKVTCMDIDEQKKKLLTVGSDKIIKVGIVIETYK